jgi:hypothetical protein
MTARKISLTLLILGLFCSLPAVAQDEPSDVEPTADVLYKAKTEIDFGTRKVNGELTAPMGTYSDSLLRQQWNPLIRLKMNFDSEIVGSVDGIR